VFAGGGAGRAIGKNCSAGNGLKKGNFFVFLEGRFRFVLGRFLNMGTGSLGYASQGNSFSNPNILIHPEYNDRESIW
jgi:hypothetical protein